MTSRKIVTVPDGVLRRKAHKVTNFDTNLQTLIDDMVETMREAPGVGLAAPQIGVLEQVVVIEFGDEEDEEAARKLYVVVNPQIARMSHEKIMGVEGCLSVPGLIGDVERSTSIVVKGQNRHGKPTKFKLSGWLARIFQHEIDHLNGVLFTDLAERIWQPEEDYVDNV
ncbi:MAG: peptide deformylase [Anaerolineales bacterium]|nr:peptide deformylase [Anaerolineales bacterium]